MSGNPASMPSAVRLLSTKLNVPRPAQGIIQRPALIKRLNLGLKCKLSVVSAPAGFGKTTLLSAWIAQHSVPVAWISLDERENEPLRFWAYFLAALQTRVPGIGETALAMFQSPQPPAVEAILTELLNEIALLPDDLVLVLDDYHAIEASAIHHGMSFLLENLPSQLHLVIATRTSPPLPLPLMRTRRELVEVNPADLRFTTSETSAFFDQVMNLKLTSEDVAKLEELTEGWIAGLQLAALSMQGIQDVPGFIGTFTGKHHYIFDYLAQEVLSRQRKEVQQFLLRTSVLERMNASLCDAVTGRSGSQQLLEELERANLFLVPLDPERRWYRYHHLFSDFLKARLQQEVAAEEISRLHRSASLWYEAHDSVSEAVEQALAAGDYEHAAALIEQAVDSMFANSELITVISWLDQLPNALLQPNFGLSLVYAWALLATGQFEVVETRLRNIERTIGFSAEGSPESLAASVEVRAILAEVACIRANLCFHQMQIGRLIELSRLSLAFLGDDVNIGPFQPVDSLRGVAVFNLGLAYEITGDVNLACRSFQETISHCKRATDLHLLMLSTSHLARLQGVQGRLQAAADIYMRTLSEAESGSLRPSPLSGQAQVGLGNLCYEWNDLENAKRHLERGIELGNQWANWETLLPGYLGLAHVRAAQGDADGALACTDGLFQLSRRLHPPWGLPLAQAERARTFLRLGNLEKAVEWARTCDLSPESDVSFAREPEAIVLANVLLAQGKPGEALSLTERLQAAAEQGGRNGPLIEILLVKALALRAQGDEPAAQSALRRALALAAPEGYVRTFIDLGTPLQALLARLAPANPAEAEYVARLRSAFLPGEQKAPPSKASGALPPGGPLSEREIAVLQLMADGFTNQEIAERLVVSLNTVKSHVKNIFDHLDVHSRTQAVSQARHLGLL